MKENLRFKQLRLNYINNQKKKRALEIVISTINVLSTIKYMVTFHLFSLLCQRRSSCWKYRKWCSYFENRYHHAKMVEKKRINFSVSPYCTLLFSKKENVNFSDVALVAVHCNSGSVALWLREDAGLEILPILQRILTCLSKTAIKTLE